MILNDEQIKGYKALLDAEGHLCDEEADAVLASHEAMRAAIRQYGRRHCGREGDGEPTCVECCELFTSVGLPLTP